MLAPIASLRPKPLDLQNGITLYAGYFTGDEQRALLEDLRLILKAAPLFQPRMPKTGTPFSVRMSNCGTLGWVSDARGGYRYQAFHPEMNTAENPAPWPEAPPLLRQLWRDVAKFEEDFSACLINYYEKTSKMGLHQDKDERDVSAPVVSLSLGDSALFRFGEGVRKSPTRSVKLSSGDVLIMHGASRLCYHGIDKLYAGSSALLSEGGRFNLTMRYVAR